MSSAEDVLTPPPRKPPRIGAWVAMALELGMLATFAWHKSLLGAALWAGYLWFSATWMMVYTVWTNDE